MSKLGYFECINSHVEEERDKLKYELGKAFRIWKFDETREEVSKEDLKSLPKKDKKGMTTNIIMFSVLD